MGGHGTGRRIEGHPAFAAVMARTAGPEGEREALGDLLAAALGGAWPGLEALARWHLAGQDPRLLLVPGNPERCPEESGPGSWQRHTARVLAAADFLGETWGLTAQQHAAACLAALFHDTSKHDGEDGEWAGGRNPDHAALAASELREAAAAFESEGLGTLTAEERAAVALAADAVACHMTVWSPSAPLAASELAPVAALVATCDTFASQAHMMWPPVASGPGEPQGPRGRSGG